MKKTLIAWLIPLSLILWIFFVLASFFVVQKPFSAATAAALGRVSLDLLAAGWLSGVALLLGRWLLARIFPVTLSFSEYLIFSPALGLGVLALLGLGAGLLGLFQPLLFYGLTLLLSLVLSPQLLSLYRHWARRSVGSGPGRWITLYLLATAGLTLLLALLPPTDWDGLFYHLTGPKLYLAAGLVEGVDIPHLSFPALMEMLFTWSMLLRGDIAAKLLHTLFAFLLAGLVYLVGANFLNKKSAWLGVVILASMPMIHTLAGWAYNDLALAFYQLAALYGWLKYQVAKDSAETAVLERREAGRWLGFSGLMAGLAMGLKYTSFVTPLVIGLLILWPALSSLRRGLGRAALFDFIIFCTVTLLVAAPWYLKNWFFTGNPVYPFLYGLFGGQFWDPFRAEWYAAANSGIGWQPGTLLALPWLLTLGLRDANYWDGRTGPLLLLFLPLMIGYGLFYGRGKATATRPPALDALLIYGLAHFAFWTLGVVWSRALWQSRLLLPGLVALAPVAGWLWADLPRFDRPAFSLSRFANLGLGLTLALTLIDISLLTLKIDPLPYLTGLESEEAYLTRRLGSHYAALDHLNETLPAGAVVAFLWEPRSYFCRVECRPDSILDEFPHLVDRYRSAPAIAAYWRQSGVSHVLIHRTGLNFVLSDLPGTVDTMVLAGLEAEHLILVQDIAGSYQLYALEPEP
jgi:4-amino-4-deoxy-L-arabinose transferase-like glycosyltransferase